MTTTTEELLALVRKSPGPFVEYLGLDFMEASSDRVVASWEVGPHLYQTHGIVHGGAHASVVETLGSVGASFWYADRGRCVGISNQTDFFRPTTEGTLTSVATPVHRGRSQQIWVVETRDEQDRLVCRGQLRLQNLPTPAAGA